MHDLLRRFEPFSDLEPGVLSGIARQTTRIRIPPGRWLLRPGRVLNHHHFLVRGRVRTLQPDATLSATSRQSRHPLYPGHAGIFTLSAVEMLRIGSRELAFLLDDRCPDARSPDENSDVWQIRFLHSHMMSSLPMPCWQGLLRVLEPMDFQAGSDVIVEGDAEHTNHCFILASGRAFVHRAQTGHRQVLRHLGPGDFFGEDALISRLPRNASVTLSESGRVMRLAREDFQRFLQQALLSEAREARSRTESAGYSSLRLNRLSITGVASLRECLDALDPCCGYRIEGDEPKAVDLAIFLLRQRGIEARRA